MNSTEARVSHLDAESIANRFRDQLVRVRTTYGETITGTLVGLTGFRSLQLATAYGFRSVNVSVVERVELADSPPVMLGGLSAQAAAQNEMGC